MKYVGNIGIKRVAVLAALFSFYAAPSMAADFDTADFSNAAVLSNNELEQNRGMNTTIYNWAELSANVIGNTANNTVSGDNNIAANAFDGFSGLATVIQNSGNNVVVQSSTIVNVTMY
jgi:hypothetical protein